MFRTYSSMVPISSPISVVNCLHTSLCPAVIPHLTPSCWLGFFAFLGLVTLPLILFSYSKIILAILSISSSKSQGATLHLLLPSHRGALVLWDGSIQVHQPLFRTSPVVSYLYTVWCDRSQGLPPQGFISHSYHI